MPKQVNILMVHLFANGDCLYATAIARQIKRDYPNCHLTWAIAPFCQSILIGNPFVDAVRVVDDVPRNDTYTFKIFKKKLEQEKAAGLWDELFITSNIDANQAYYDGTIRGMILRSYPGQITVPIQPILNLQREELDRVEQFAQNHHLHQFKKVILWEYAPQSGQSELSKELVWEVSRQLTKNPEVAVILSSPHRFDSEAQIIDASTLSIRENAALSHHCHLLIGCSSGITWLCTSTAGKQLPMLQLLNPHALFLNAPSIDFTRYGMSTDELIEMTSWNAQKVVACVEQMLTASIAKAKKEFNQGIRPHFRTTEKIIYDRLCFLQFGALFTHIRIMFQQYGFNVALCKSICVSIFGFPFKLIRQFWLKRNSV
jgi:hypothetical protein